MKRLTDWVHTSKLVRNMYKLKFYFDLGVKQINWFSSKLPELMAFVYLTSWLGWELSKSMLGVFCVGVAVGLVVTGYAWKNMGLFDIEVLVDTSKNPVSSKIYKAAKLIIKRYDKK